MCVPCPFTVRRRRGVAISLVTVSLVLSQVSSAATVSVLPGLGAEAWAIQDAIEETSAAAINNAGVVVGQTGSNPRLSGEGEAVRWINGEIQVLPRFADAAPNGLNFGAADVNDAGVVVGFSSFPSPKQPYGYHAAKWVGNDVTDLGTLPGHDSSAAVAVNRTGQVAGTSMLGGFFGTQLAVRWLANGQISPLGLLPRQDAALIQAGHLEHDRGAAYDMNAAGRIVGYSEFFGERMDRLR